VTAALSEPSDSCTFRVDGTAVPRRSAEQIDALFMRTCAVVWKPMGCGHAL
jgi:hypothetical protein